MIRITRLAGFGALVCCALAGLIGCTTEGVDFALQTSPTVRATVDATDTATDAQPASEPAPAADAPPVIVGISGEDLVRYDPVSGDTTTLVPEVGMGGALSISPGGEWIAYECPRRWDGLDVTDVVFINLRAQAVEYLSEMEGEEHYSLAVSPLGWGDGVFYFTDETPWSDGTRGESAIDLETGTARRLPEGVPAGVVPWALFTEEWGHQLNVPNPEPAYEGEFSDGHSFWSISVADVSPDGRWGICVLQQDYPHPSADDPWPVYLLSAEGDSKRMPLARPAVFAGTLVLE